MIERMRVGQHIRIEQLAEAELKIVILVYKRFQGQLRNLQLALILENSLQWWTRAVNLAALTAFFLQLNFCAKFNTDRLISLIPLWHV